MYIIAGLYKGRKLLPPPGSSSTRPITGLAKKSLFDILAGRLDGATVLDLYCGTGTMGLEALSRGAEHCCFAERDRAVLTRLERNIDAFGVRERCTVWRGDVTSRLRHWLAGLARPVDVAFVDPPYADVRRWDWQRIAEEVFTPLAGRLAEGGVVVLRCPAEVALPAEIGPLAIARRQRYGAMVVALLGPRPAE